MLLRFYIELKISMEKLFPSEIYHQNVYYYAHKKVICICLKSSKITLLLYHVFDKTEDFIYVVKSS